MLEFAPQIVFNGFVLGSIYVLVALGLTLIFGIVDVVNFAHGEFYMLGAFGTFIAVTQLGVSYPLAVVLSTLVVAGIGFFTEKVLIKKLRDRGGDPISYVLVTVGLSVFLISLVAYILGPDLRQIPSPYMKVFMNFGEVYLTLHRLIVMCVGFGLVFALSYFVKYTSIGNQMRATSQNNQAAMIVGVNINKIYTITFIVGASLSAIAGSLVGAMLVTEPNMGVHIIVKAFVVVIVGGMGSIIGSIIAGFGLGIIETFSGYLMPSEYIDIVGFSIMILVLLVKPNGIMGVKGGRLDA